MNRADQVADAIEALLRSKRWEDSDPTPLQRLATVLETALDRYELARLLCVATNALGRSPIPEHPAEWVRHTPARWTPSAEEVIAGNLHATARRHRERAERLDRLP